MARKYNVYGIGNALVDIQFEVSPQFLEEKGIDKGVMTLVEEERQVMLLSALSHLPSKRSSGGSAANTMIGAVQLGGTTAYACKVADDVFGEFFVSDMQAGGVACDPTRSPVGVTGTCLVLITPDADRTMNTFLGITSTFGPADVDRNRLADSDFLYIEGYLLTSETGLAAALAAQQAARESGTRVALTLSDPFIVEAFGERMRQVVAGGVDLLFCNEAEARAYTGGGSTIEALETLGGIVDLVAVTCGPDGARIRQGGKTISIPGFAVDAVDTNGAGDLFAGAFLGGITAGRSLEDAGKLASYASSRVVAQFGPRLPGSLVDQIDRILSS